MQFEKKDLDDKSLKLEPFTVWTETAKTMKEGSIIEMLGRKFQVTNLQFDAEGKDRTTVVLRFLPKPVGKRPGQLASK